MPINFKTYSDLWINAVNDKDTQGLSQVLSDDFVWSNERFNYVANKQETIDWCKNTNLKVFLLLLIMKMTRLW